MKVFLSYSPEDRGLAQRLGDDLRRRGHDVYPAAHWPENVEAAVRRADAFVAILSPAAVASPFVQREVSLALVSERLADRLIPVVLQGAEIPWILEKMAPISVGRTLRDLGGAVSARLEQPPNNAK